MHIFTIEQLIASPAPLAIKPFDVTVDHRRLNVESNRPATSKLRPQDVHSLGQFLGLSNNALFMIEEEIIERDHDAESYGYEQSTDTLLLDGITIEYARTALALRMDDERYASIEEAWEEFQTRYSLREQPVFTQADMDDIPF